MSRRRRMSVGSNTMTSNKERTKSMEFIKKSILKQANEIQSVEMKKLIIEQAILKHMINQKKSID